MQNDVPVPPRHRAPTPADSALIGVTAITAAGAWLYASVSGGWAAYPAALFCYSLAWWRCHQSAASNRLIFCLGVPFVLAALVLPPRLSDDYHRYLWEGHVQNHGFSPYAAAPRTLFETFHHPAEPYINNPDLPAIYPPLSQMLFRLADLLGHHIFGWKCLLLAALITCRCFLSTRQTLLLIGHPLILVEGLWNAHLDVLGIPLVYALLCHMQRGRLGRGVSAGVALFALKLLPVVLCLFPLRQKSPRWVAAYALGGVLGAVLVYLPFAADGAALLRSPSAFSQHWYFNNPLFTVLQYQVDPTWIRPLLGGALLLSWVWLWMRPWPVRDRARLAWIALLCFSPTVYPWYLLWLMPLLRFRDWPWAAAAFGFACLSYRVLPNWHLAGVWSLPMPWLTLEWLGLLLCFYAMRPRRITPSKGFPS